MTWEKAVSIEALRQGAALFKRPPRQIALFLVNERVYAVDNRCPHEGYPLVEGHVDENCVLTCNWHNWKFRLEDGRCVLGGDHVRAYPAELRQGEVWVDLADPPLEEVRRSIFGGLETAFEKRDYGRICREITRLRYSGLDPLLAVDAAVKWSHDRFEFGTTHAFAAAADWLARYDRLSGDWERQLVCLAEAVDHMAFDALRHRAFPFAAARGDFLPEAFLAAVEAEDHAAAEAIVRGGLERGARWTDMEEAFTAAALAHYNDFGHSLIFVYKTAQLAARASEETTACLVLPLARSLCYTTREDLLPEFGNYAAVLSELSRLAEPTKEAADAASRLDVDSLFPANTRDAFDWLLEHAPTHRAATLYDALLDGLARSLLYYDSAYQDAYDRPVSANVGWLDFTHGITFANAARGLCEKYPRLWRPALLQMACFLGRNRPFLDLNADPGVWFVEDREEFFRKVHLELLDHGLSQPIYSSHLLKTAMAVEAELPQSSASCRKHLLAGLNRFLHSPLKQKHARRLARQAIALVGRDFGAAQSDVESERRACER